MKERHTEEIRLNQLSEQTDSKFSKFLNIQSYVNLLQQFDNICNDGIRTSECPKPSFSCGCILCIVYKV